MKALALRHFKFDTPIHILKSLSLGIISLYVFGSGIFGLIFYAVYFKIKLGL